MKPYPSIDGPSRAPRQQMIAFEKYDGSNLRFEWSRKRGWYKFGTRKRLFDESDSDFGEAISLFMNTHAQPLEDILKANWRDDRQAMAFCEFLGDNSFAGQHISTDPKRLVLIDVNIHKRGFVDPRTFVNIFCKNLGDLAARVVHEGKLNESFIQDVRDGKYDVFEGVVCKGGSGHKIWRCKIKTLAYKALLKDMYGEGWHKFWEGEGE